MIDVAQSLEMMASCAEQISVWTAEGLTPSEMVEAVTGAKMPGASEQEAHDILVLAYATLAQRVPAKSIWDHPSD